MAAWAVRKNCLGVLNVPVVGRIKTVAIVVLQQARKVVLRVRMQSMGQCDLMRGSPCALTPEWEDVNISQLPQLLWVIGS